MAGTENVVTPDDEPSAIIDGVKLRVTATEALLMTVQFEPSMGLDGAVRVWLAVEPEKSVISLRPTVAEAERSERCDEIVVVQVPGVPAVVQVQMDPVWSIMKSPTANVPDVGALFTVPPTYRVADVAPVRPVALKSVPVTSPVNVGPETLPWLPWLPWKP